MKQLGKEVTRLPALAVAMIKDSARDAMEAHRKGWIVDDRWEDSDVLAVAIEAATRAVVSEREYLLGDVSRAPGDEQAKRAPVTVDGWAIYDADEVIKLVTTSVVQARQLYGRREIMCLGLNREMDWTPRRVRITVEEAGE